MRADFIGSVQGVSPRRFLKTRQLGLVVSFVLFPARLFLDVLELALVACLQDSDAATMGYKRKRFTRLFNEPFFLWMVMSCHVCCNSDLYITFANLQFSA